MKLSILAVNTGNTKLGKGCATTYAAPSSCPTYCSLRGAGCYAEVGTVALHFLRLDSASDPRTVARSEARQIDAVASPNGRPLRLHTAGDCRTIRSAQIVYGACERWIQRGGGPIWTYTHAWRHVPRSAWGVVSVMASADKAADLERIRLRGYAPTRVVGSFEATDLRADGIRWIPCPAQVRENVTCQDCRICWNGDRLFAGKMGVLFEAHGARKRAAVEACRA